MPFQIICPACENAHRAPKDVLFGKSVKCSKCQFKFAIGKENLFETQNPPRAEIPESYDSNSTGITVDDILASVENEKSRVDPDLESLHERMKSVEPKVPPIPTSATYDEPDPIPSSRETILLEEVLKELRTLNSKSPDSLQQSFWAVIAVMGLLVAGAMFLSALNSGALLSTNLLLFATVILLALLVLKPQK